MKELNLVHAQILKAKGFAIEDLPHHLGEEERRELQKRKQRIMKVEREPRSFKTDLRSYEHAVWQRGTPVTVEEATRLEHEGYTVFLGALWGYTKKSGESTVFGRADLIGREDKTTREFEVTEIRFGSEEAKEELERHLKGVHWSEAYQETLKEVHEVVFEYFRTDEFCRSKLREFGEQRGWHKPEIREKVFDFVRKNKFGERQFLKYVGERFGIDRERARAIFGTAEKVFAFNSMSMREPQFSEFLREYAPEFAMDPDSLQTVLGKLDQKIFDEFGEELAKATGDKKFPDFHEMRARRTHASEMVRDAFGMNEEENDKNDKNGAPEKIPPERQAEMIQAVLDHRLTETEKEDKNWKKFKRIFRLKKALGAAVADFQYEDLAGLCYVGFPFEDEKGNKEC